MPVNEYMKIVYGNQQYILFDQYLYMKVCSKNNMYFKYQVKRNFEILSQKY